MLPRIADRGLRKGHEEVYAVIVPDLDRFEQDKIVAKEEIKNKISNEIAQLSKNLAPYKRIVSFDISYEELPKTVTKKIRRDAVSVTAAH